MWSVVLILTFVIVMGEYAGKNGRIELQSPLKHPTEAVCFENLHEEARSGVEFIQSADHPLLEGVTEVNVDASCVEFDQKGENQ